MTQADIDRQVAAATGEDISTINGMGFVPLTSVPYESERRPLTVDWDALDRRRTSILPHRNRRRVAVA